MPVKGLGPMCSVHACMRPVRELGQLCTTHWMALTAQQRLSLQWEDIHTRDEAQRTEPFDSEALARSLREAADEIAALPEYTGTRRFAA